MDSTMATEMVILMEIPKDLYLDSDLEMALDLQYSVKQKETQMDLSKEMDSDSTKVSQKVRLTVIRLGFWRGIPTVMDLVKLMVILMG